MKSQGQSRPEQGAKTYIILYRVTLKSSWKLENMYIFLQFSAIHAWYFFHLMSLRTLYVLDTIWFSPRGSYFGILVSSVVMLELLDSSWDGESWGSSGGTTLRSDKVTFTGSDSSCYEEMRVASHAYSLTSCLAKWQGSTVSCPFVSLLFILRSCGWVSLLL